MAVVNGSPHAEDLKCLAVMSLLRQIPAITVGRACWPPSQLEIFTGEATAPDLAG
jgi:hypothetical protein